MKLPRTATFDDESARFALRFCCDDCAHFDPAGDHCRHDWPTELHRSAHYRAPADVCAPEVVFCKEFELC